MKIPILLGSLMCVIFCIGCDSHSLHQETVAYPVIYPARQDTSFFKEYVCQIHSFQHIEVRALEKGYLENIYVDEGQLVQKGQVLFKIMPLVYQAEVQKAEAELKFVEVEYLNTQQLAEKNIVSPNELALAKAKLEKAKAELALARTHLSFTEIRAPFSGIVGRFHARLGSLLDEGELLTTLSDNSKVWVYFNVPEVEYLDFVTNYKKDSLLKVKLQMANRKMFDYDGVVETIEADFDNETGNIAFRATFPNPKGILRHGETGNILMPVSLKKALLIPQKATFEILGKHYVFVVDKDDVVHMREISISNELPHLFVVSKGITEEDRILLEGLRKVKKGDKVMHYTVRLPEILQELRQLHAE
ncbi:MAG: efflux RND transporter periplasmic adaptor subunit [Cytophagales bacterium]|nr:efflux RND transporter periplasmic adaptor subunit [Cytophagales bacterium]MDW8383199.1 efflux RND transporter periplasmic adaptor subunit [Flammeovirgaceae bacterium]